MDTHRLARIESEARKHRFVGGCLCLDFANTINGHGGTPMHEYLATYVDLLIWSHKAGILSEHDAESILPAANRNPREAAAAFGRAIALRGTIFRIFSALALGDSPSQDDIAALDHARAIALTHSHIHRTLRGYVIDWDNKTALDRMHWHLSASAADLLVSDKRLSVRSCRSDKCDWLFIDTSPNQLRRWCSMEECGNRSKVRRYYRRRHGLAAEHLVRRGVK
jgi:predicted RNA-binding Zn ribbon-like protein